MRDAIERVKSGVKLMKDISVFITPSVEPSYEDLSEMIEAAGGVCFNLSLILGSLLFLLTSLIFNLLVLRKSYRTFLCDQLRMYLY